MLTGEIRIALRPRPPRVTLGTVAPGSEHSADVRVAKLEPVRIVTILPRGEGVSAQRLNETEEGFDLRVTVKVPWSRRSQAFT